MDIERIKKLSNAKIEAGHTTKQEKDEKEKDEFSTIAHKLNELGHITNNQLIDLLKEYII